MGNEVKFIVSAETRQAAAALTSFLGGLQSGLARVAGPLAALVSVGGLTALAKQSLNAAEAMGKAAQLAGVAAKEFAGMAYAADRDEVDLGSLRTALKELSNEMSKTGQGSKNLKDALLEQADIFAQLPDGIAKNNLAIQTFGRSGLQMIPFLNQGSEAMKQMFERGERLTGINDELAMSADEFNDALKDLHVASVGLAGSLVSGLIPNLTRLLNSVTEGIVRFREWAKESLAFEVAVKSLAIALGVLAAIKLGSLATNGLGLLIGAGSIKNLKDFIAALQLVPAAATAAAAGMGKFALSIAAVTEAILAAKFWWEMWSAKANEQEEIYQTAQANEALARSIRERIEAERAAGKISEEQFQAMRQRLLAATALANSDEVQDALSALSSDLIGPGGLKPRVTADAFNTKRNEDLLRIAEQQAKNEDVIAKAKSEQTKTEFRLLTAAEAIQKLEVMRKDTMRAYLDGAITRQDKTKLEIEDLTQIRQLEAEILDLKVRRIQSDFTKTDAEKYDAMREAGVPKDQLGADPSSMVDQWRAGFATLRDEWGTLQQQISEGFFNILNNGVNLVSDGITSMLFQTEGWRQKLAQIPQQILQGIVGSIVQMGLRWVATMALTAIAGEAIAATTTAALAPIAAAQAAVWTTPAALATIASYGGAAAASPAQVSGALAAIKVITLASSGLGFAEGGYTGAGGKHEVAGLVHRDEWVMPSSSVRAWGKDAMAAFQAGPAAAASPAASQANQSIKVVVVSDIKQAMAEVMKSPLGQQVIVQTVSGNKYELGFQT